MDLPDLQNLPELDWQTEAARSEAKPHSSRGPDWVNAGNVQIYLGGAPHG
jgi:hypothetical protein